jgi:tRNA threonylcarbamoyladenosine biosynthesis protein TsaE
MFEFVIATSSAQETQLYAIKLATHLQAGDVILLSGDLGAGKTTFSQGIGSAFGVEEMTSPTFVISKIYNAHTASKRDIRLLHLDLYRITNDSLGVFDDLDIESYLPSSVVLIEWGEKHVSRLADNYLSIELKSEGHETDRTITINPIGDEEYIARWDKALTAVKP